MTASGRSGPNWSISRLAIIADPSSMAGRLFGLGVEACAGPMARSTAAFAIALRSQLGTWPVKACPCSKACHRTFSSSLLWNVRKQQLVDLPAPETSCWRPRRRCGPDHTPQLPKSAHVGAVSNFISFVEGGVTVLLGLILFFPVFIVLVVHNIGSSSGQSAKPFWSS